ncbi:NfeD family protein [Castellaniella caeni]|uniref:NfeD family protein n=1 Tax=Castellaniella caeni TaxID=266123 RepID=UPI00082BE652|nr:NfeD family protein [Castellaniella caeni]
MLLVYFSSQAVWAFTLLGLVLLLALVIAIQAHRHRAQGGNEELPGMLGEVTEASDTRGRAWALVRGEIWQVHAAEPLQPGETVRVLRVRGLVLGVERVPAHKPSTGDPS